MIRFKKRERTFYYEVVTHVRKEIDTILVNSQNKIELAQFSTEETVFSTRNDDIL